MLKILDVLFKDLYGHICFGSESKNLFSKCENIYFHDPAANQLVLGD